MNVPQLRFDGFDGEWEVRNFSDAFDIIDGDRGKNYPSSDDYLKEGYCLFLNAKNVTKNGFLFEETMFIDKFKDRSMTKGKLNKNDLIMTTRGTIGNVAFYSQEIPFENIRINSGMVILRSKINDPLYDFIFLNSSGFEKTIKFTVFGSAQPQLTVKDIKKMKISFPQEKEEQEKISSFFLYLNQRIEKQQEKVEKLEQFKKGMMQKIFSQELRFKDEDGGEFGEWEEKLLNEISFINPKTEPLEKEFYYMDLESVDKGRVKDLKTVNIEDAPSRAQRVLRKDDVLFQTVRPYQQNHYYLEELSDQQIVASTGFAQIRTDHNSRYIYYLIHTEEFSQEVLNRCTGTSYPAINSSHLSKINVPVPSLAEQTKIADFLFNLDKKLTKEIEKLMVLEEQKKGFMQGMFV